MKNVVSLFISITSLVIVFALYHSQSLVEAAQIEGSVEEKLQTANEAYSNSRYDEAINGYKTIIAELGFSANLLYNLGNSYAQKGESGLAILHYLRGLQLSPGDSDIQGDLELARKNSGLFEDIPTLQERFFNTFDMNQWAFFALSAYILITILLVINNRFPLKKGMKTGGGLLLIATIAISCTGIFKQRTLWNSAVITAPDIRLLMSPFESASSLGAIQEGSLVFSEKTHGDYQHVSDLKGRSGWIPTTSLESINVSHATYSQADAAQ